SEAFAILHVKTVFQDLCLWCERRESRARAVMRGASVAVEKSSTGSQKRAGTDRDELMTAADYSPEPVDDRSFSVAISWPLHLVLACHYLVHVAAQYNHRSRRDNRRQWFDPGQHKSNRTQERRLRPDVVHLEADSSLQAVGSAQHFEWSCHVEQKRLRRQY